MNYQAKKKNTKALIYLMNNELKIGDIVVFRKLVKGKWQGVEKTPHIVVETGLKFEK